MSRRILTSLLALLLVTAALGAQEILFDKKVQAGGLTCFPVRGDENTWYYLPDRPHLVVDPETQLPEFSFLMYVAPQQTESEGITRAPGGGILHFLVAYDVPEDVVRDAERELARKKPGAKLMGPVTFEDGRFAITTAIADPQAGFVRRVVGTGAAPVMPGHKATASMHLTQLGASLLWEGFHQSTAPITASFEMTLSGYYNPVEANMVVDWEKVNQVLEAGAAGRVSFVAFEVDVLLQKMLQNGAITIELVGAPPSQWNDIQKIGIDLARSVLFERSGTASLQDLERLGGGSLLDRYDRETNRSRHSLLEPWSWPSGFPWAVGGTPPFWIRREACWACPPLPPPVTPVPEAESPRERPNCTEEARRHAKELFYEGVREYRANHYQAARRLWRESIQACENPSSHADLAVVALDIDPRDSGTWRDEILRWASFIRAGARTPNLRRALNEVRQLPDRGEVPEDLQDRVAQEWNNTRKEDYVTYVPSDSEHAEAEQIAEAPPTPEPSPTPRRPTSSGPASARSTTAATPTRTPSSRSAARTARSTSTSRSGGSHRTRTPHSRSTRTPRVHSRRTPRAHPTRSPRTRRTPTPRTRRRGREESSSGVLVRFRLRRVQRSGKLTLSLKQWHRVTRTIPFGAPLGDLTAYLSNPKLFRRVNIDDPVFKQREIPVTVDVAGAEAFGEMLNSVTVTLRKRHQSGRESLDEVTIRRSHIAEGTVPKLLYGWDQDANRTRWLQYDYRVRWAYVGGPEIDTGWRTTSAGALVLEPPLRPRTILLEADTGMLREAGVRHVTLDLRYDAAGVQRRATTTLKPSQLEGERRLVIYQAPDHPEYRYALHWRFRGGRTVSSPMTPSSDGIIYLDEIPQS